MSFGEVATPTGPLSGDEPHLHACIRDLVAISAMPAWWMGWSPAAIAASVRDLLRDVLRADAVFVQVRDPDSEETHHATLDVVRDDAGDDASGGERAAARVGVGWFEASTAMRLATHPVGVDGSMGHFTVGSLHPDFPNESESLLMQVAANVMAVALRHAGLLARHQRAQRLLEVMAKRMADAQAQSERASAATSEFLAVMSHELRTPLNAIGGYAELLEMGLRGPVTESQRTDLARIRRNQQYLLSLIRNILTFMKLGSGRLRFEIEVVNVDDVLAATDAAIRPQMDSRALSFERQGLPQVMVHADRDKFQQILLNLLSNAAKFTDPGGSVRLDCDAADETVSIRVADTGCGIAAEKLQSVFEPFVQIDRGLARTAEGTGLGLSISRDFATAMGGDILIASEVGKGTVFTLVLPRAWQGGEAPLEQLAPELSETNVRRPTRSDEPGAACSPLRARPVTRTSRHDHPTA